MNTLQNEILFSVMNGSRTIARMIDRTIRKWVDRLGPHDPQSPPRYSVRIHRERRNAFSCDLEIRLANRTWRGISDARAIQETVLEALRDICVQDCPQNIPALQFTKNPDTAA